MPYFTTLRDKDLPRATEIMEAHAARVGSITLDETKHRVLLSRLFSIGFSATLAMSDAEADEGERTLACYVAGSAGTMLGLLGVTQQEARTVLRALLDDATAVAKRNL